MRSAYCLASNILSTTLKITYNLMIAAVLFLSQKNSKDSIMCSPLLCAVKSMNGLRNESAVVRRKNSMRARKHVQIGSM